jgi:hypothetical protein
MQSEFKLLKVNSGRCHFAQVIVEATRVEAGVDVIERASDHSEASQGEKKYRPPRLWIDAAISGARSCCDALISRGHLGGCQVVIVQVIGTVVDTLEEDVMCASALAVWQALQPNLPLPRFEYHSGKWLIAY